MILRNQLAKNLPKKTRFTVKKLIRKTFPKIRIVKIKGINFYRVDARKQGTNGKREHFLDKAKAESRAADIEAEFRANGVEGLALPVQLRAMAVRCQDKLTKFCKTLDHATDFYVRHLEREIAKNNSAVVSTLADEWHTSRKNDGNKKLRQRTVDGIRKHAEILKRTFGDKRLLEISSQDIQNYLDGLNVSQRRKYNLRSATSQFFNWCIKKKYATENPTAAIEIEVPLKDPAILTVEKCIKVLTACEKDFADLALYTAISLFAGLRPTECQFLKWADIHLEERQITVLKETSKVSETRNVPIEDNLYFWFSTHKGEKRGFVTDQTNLTKRLQKLRVAVGFKQNGANEEGEKWVEDYFRHSYASYWIAKYNDRARLAENMGNSIEVIRKHYKCIVSKSDVEKFWCILPASVEEPQTQAGGR